MTKDEMTEYWQGLANKAGLSDDQTQAVVASLSDEAVAKTFTDGFRSAPEYNKGLDANRADYNTKAADADKRATELTNWYNTEAKPAYEQNLQGVSTLQKYQELYGALDDDTAKVKPAAQPDKQVNAVTREELDKVMHQRGQETVALMKSATLMGGDYAHRFKKPLSEEQINEVEKVAVDNGLSLGKAYDMWVAPAIHKQETDALEVKHKKDTEEAVRDALSQHNLPVDSTQPDHPFFNPPKQEGDGKSTPAEAQQHSKSAFLNGWAESSG